MSKALKTHESQCSPQELLDKLTSWKISYSLYEHEALFTVEDTKRANLDIPGTHCRNLYLRDNKKKNYLVVLRDETPLDMKKLSDVIGSGRLSFGSADRLWEFLGVRPGSVCPFATINDIDKQVQVILEQAMMESELIDFHPLDNTMTVAITPEGLRSFFRQIGRDDVREVDLSSAQPT